MAQSTKSEYLQVRVSPEEKRKIKALAKQAGISMSELLVDSLLSRKTIEFYDLVEQLQVSGKESYALSEIHDFLEALDPLTFRHVIQQAPATKLKPYWSNYLAAMLELAASKKSVPAPSWLGNIKALGEPHFVSNLNNLRMHLLLNSPAPFRRRNIFIDSSLGQRV